MVDADSKPTDRYDMTEGVLRAAQYMRCKIVPEVQRQLKHEVDKEFLGVSERVKGRTLELLNEAVATIFRVLADSQGQNGYQSPQSGPAPDSALATPEPRASPPPPPPGLSFAADVLADTSALPDAADFSLDFEAETFAEQFLTPRNDDDRFAWDPTYGTLDGYALNCI